MQVDSTRQVFFWAELTLLSLGLLETTGFEVKVDGATPKFVGSVRGYWDVHGS